MDLLLKYTPNKQIENYTFSLDACIGKGSSGTVYIGKHSQTQQVVAIKAVDMRSLKTEYAWKMLCSEVKIMKKLKHPHVVRLLDVFQTKNNTYIVTEFCNQGDLRTYIKKKKLLTERESIAVISQIMSGLQELALNGIIHRDLKPANILIHDDVFKITDFGFAKKLDNMEDQLMDSLVGTPLYMAPQILNKQQYTSKCDVWSVGLILYELLYGRTPWPAVNLVDLVQKMCTITLNFPKEPQVSQLLTNFINKCLCFPESDRISIQDMCSYQLFEDYVNQINRFLVLQKQQLGGTASNTNLATNNNLTNFSSITTQTQTTQKNNQYNSSNAINDANVQQLNKNKTTKYSQVNQVGLSPTKSSTETRLNTNKGQQQNINIGQTQVQATNLSQKTNPHQQISSMSPTKLHSQQNAMQRKNSNFDDKLTNQQEQLYSPMKQISNLTEPYSPNSPTKISNQKTSGILYQQAKSIQQQMSNVLGERELSPIKKESYNSNNFYLIQNNNTNDKKITGGTEINEYQTQTYNSISKNQNMSYSPNKQSYNQQSTLTLQQKQNQQTGGVLQRKYTNDECMSPTILPSSQYSNIFSQQKNLQTPLTNHQTKSSELINEVKSNQQDQLPVNPSSPYQRSSNSNQYGDKSFKETGIFLQQTQEKQSYSNGVFESDLKKGDLLLQQYTSQPFSNIGSQEVQGINKGQNNFTQLKIGDSSSKQDHIRQYSLSHQYSFQKVNNLQDQNSQIDIPKKIQNGPIEKNQSLEQSPSLSLQQGGQYSSNQQQKQFSLNQNLQNRYSQNNISNISGYSTTIKSEHSYHEGSSNQSSYSGYNTQIVQQINTNTQQQQQQHQQQQQTPSIQQYQQYLQQDKNSTSIERNKAYNTPSSQTVNNNKSLGVIYNASSYLYSIPTINNKNNLPKNTENDIKNQFNSTISQIHKQSTSLTKNSQIPASQYSFTEIGDNLYSENTSLQSSPQIYKRSNTQNDQQLESYYCHSKNTYTPKNNSSIQSNKNIISLKNYQFKDSNLSSAIENQQKKNESINDSSQIHRSPQQRRIKSEFGNIFQNNNNTEFLKETKKFQQQSPTKNQIQMNSGNQQFYQNSNNQILNVFSQPEEANQDGRNLSFQQQNQNNRSKSVIQGTNQQYYSVNNISNQQKYINTPLSEIKKPIQSPLNEDSSNFSSVVQRENGSPKSQNQYQNYFSNSQQVKIQQNENQKNALSGLKQFSHQDQQQSLQKQNQFENTESLPQKYKKYTLKNYVQNQNSIISHNKNNSYSGNPQTTNQDIHINGHNGNIVLKNQFSTLQENYNQFNNENNSINLSGNKNYTTQSQLQKQQGNRLSNFESQVYQSHHGHSKSLIINNFNQFTNSQSYQLDSNINESKNNKNISDEFYQQDNMIESIFQLCKSIRFLKNQIDYNIKAILKLDIPFYYEKLIFLLNKHLVMKISMLKIIQMDNGINIIKLDRWTEYRASQNYNEMYKKIEQTYFDIMAAYQNNWNRVHENQSFYDEAKKDYYFSKIFNENMNEQTIKGSITNNKVVNDEDNTNFYFYVYQLLKEIIKEVFNKLQKNITKNLAIDSSKITREDSLVINCLSRLVDYHQLLKLTISQKENFSLILKSINIPDLMKEKIITIEFYETLKQKMYIYDLIQK